MSETNRDKVNKPYWISNDAWAQMMQQCNGIPKCAVTGDTTNLSIDHIIARANGGTDDISNLQFLREDLNRRKGTKDDTRWASDLYWDKSHDLAGFRTAQLYEAYLKLYEDYADWFSKPRSQIARLIYTLAWVVSAGKTLAIPAIAFAYNRLIRGRFGVGAPRADTILVLTKETAIRDQLARDISDDLVKYGICSQAPRYKVITKGSEWGQDHYHSADMVVACVQQLWERGTGSVGDLAKILARFPLIFIDEPHWGLEQAMLIVQQAYTSLVFGLTGTPIEARGETIKKFVLFSVYSYSDANDNDNSVKHCSIQPEYLPDMLEEIGIDNAQYRFGTNERVINTTKEYGYDKALVPVISVAERCVSYVSDCDRILPLGATLAPHRPETAEPSLHYPVHVMMRLETKTIAYEVQNHLNTMFTDNPRLYPRDLGYWSDVVLTDLDKYEEIENGNSKSIEKVTKKGQCLDPEHPWMVCKNTGGKFKYKVPKDGFRKKGQIVLSSRFLLVVGIGREGVNNPYCGGVGVACSCSSEVEHVQRTLGRQLRALLEMLRDMGRMRVPSARQDTIKIITHAAFNNRDAILRAMNYVVNMRERLSDMQTMDELIKETYVPPEGGVLDTAEGLSPGERISLAAGVGTDKNSGSDIDPEKVLNRVLPGASNRKREQGKEWVELVQTEPRKAQERLCMRAQLETIPTVMRELPTARPSPADLRRFLTIHKPNLVGYLSQLDNPGIHDFAIEMYQEHVRRFHIGSIHPTQNINAVRKSIVGELMGTIHKHFRPRNDKDRSEPFQLVGSAVKSILGSKGPAENGSEWDCPVYHAILNRPEVRRSIIGFCQTILIKKGLLPDLAAGLCMEVGDSAEVV